MLALGNSEEAGQQKMRPWNQDVAMTIVVIPRLHRRGAVALKGIGHG
jgi:hypothetical protein